MTSEHVPIDRTKVTFEQAEGLAPLPQQLKAREISSELRAVMWSYIFSELDDHTKGSYNRSTYISHPWSYILQDLHVFHLHKNIDEFSSEAKDLNKIVKMIITHSTYGTFFGFLQFVIRHTDCPDNFADDVNSMLIKS